MANTTIYPFGTNGQLPSSIGVINDLTTGGADKALSAEMGKELGNAVNGIAEVTGTFVASAFSSHIGTGAAVGETFSDTLSTNYGITSAFTCCSMKVSAGDKIHVKAKANGYNGGVSITDSSKTVTYASGKSATLINQDFNITANGYVYVSNATGQLASPELKRYPVDGHEQRIDTLEDVVATLPAASAFDALKDINGRELTGTFEEGYYANGSATVGGTSNPSKQSSNSYLCCKMAVQAGDSLEIYAQGNAYNQTVVITDSNNVVKYVSGTDTLVCFDEIMVVADGWVYVNNMKDSSGTLVIQSPICRVYNEGNKQRIEQLANSLQGFVIERSTISVPIELGLNPYPNTASYFWETANPSSTTGCTGWIALPKGKYIKTLAKSGTIYQADKPLFADDYAVKGTNIFEKSIPSGNTIIEINKKYAFIKISSIDSTVTSLELTPVDITAPAAEQPNNKLAHVSHGKDGFILYLPMKEKFMAVAIEYYTQNSSRYPHFGIDLFYDSGSDDIFLPKLGNAFTRGGETECAISVNGNGHNGYIGGHTHGYERIVTADTTVYLDGDFKEVSEKFAADVNTMFELQTHTQYLAASGIGTESEVVIADLYKRWRIVDGKLHLYNRVVWNVATHINQAQLSMFCIYRHEGGNTSNPYLTNRATRNDSTFVYKTIDGWDYDATEANRQERYAILNAPTKATRQEQWGESGYFVTQDLYENNAKENGGLMIKTNTETPAYPGTYNKMYFEIGSNFDVVEGDELFSHAVLSIE